MLQVQQPRARLSAMQQDALDAVADVFRLEGGGRLPGSPRQQVLSAVACTACELASAGHKSQMFGARALSSPSSWLISSG